MNRWLLINSGARGAAFNMALDEALLEAMPRIGKPVLRFYGWTEPAASFGYFQKFEDVERAMLLRPLVRRPTGGGIVPHDADWTYSLVFPTSHDWYSLTAIESYRRVHEWIQAAFAKLNTETQLAPSCKKSVPSFRSNRHKEAPSKSELRSPKPKTDQSLLTSAATSVLPDQCFAGYEKFDVLWQGRKIAGAAQRRKRLGLLIQGSIQPPPVSLARTDWEWAMREVASAQFRVKWSEFALDAPLRERAANLTVQKYAREDFNRKR